MPYKWTSDFQVICKITILGVIKMSKDSSARYYQKRKERLKKWAREKYQGEMENKG